MAKLNFNEEQALCLLIRYYLRKHGLTAHAFGLRLKLASDTRRTKPVLTDFLNGKSSNHGKEIRDAFEEIFFQSEQFEFDDSDYILALLRVAYPRQVDGRGDDVIAPHGLISKAINRSPGIMEDISTAFVGIWNVIRYSEQIKPEPAQHGKNIDCQVVWASMQVRPIENKQKYPTFEIHYMPEDADLTSVAGILIPLESHVLFLGIDERTHYPLEVVVPISRGVHLKKFSGVVFRKLEYAGVFVARVDFFRSAAQDLSQLDKKIGFRTESDMRSVWPEISRTDKLDDVLEGLRAATLYEGKGGLLVPAEHMLPRKATASRQARSQNSQRPARKRTSRGR